jgi:hypothetical protein
MMSRIGFRHVLPILFVLIHVLLVLFTSAGQHEVSCGADSSCYPPISDMPPTPLTFAQTTVLVLNLPALVLSVPTMVMLASRGDVPLLLACVPFILFVWYVVGRWVDRLLGVCGQPRMVRRTLSGVFVVVSTALLVVGILILTPLNQHRTTDMYWLGGAWVFWSGLFLAMSVSRYYRRGSQLQ